MTSYWEKTILQPAQLSILILAENPDFEAPAKRLAAELDLGFCPDRTTIHDGLLLVLSEGGLQLEASGGKMKPLRVDFTAKALLWRLAKGGGLQQPVARAVGLKPGWRPMVLDATAGLGQDAFILASLGCTVEMVERSPIIGALLADGLNRARLDERVAPIAERLSLRVGVDSIAVLRDKEHPAVDVVFLDPMYPDIGRTAMPKKELLFLRRAVGDDTDASDLLAAALECAGKRVVVKRPRLAPAIDGPPPSFNQTGKSSRFDIYLR